jgi:two-component system phosphate regulon sensor histidine kinase PhoR
VIRLSAYLLRSLLLILLTAIVSWPLGRLVAPWVGWSVFSAGLALQLGFQLRNFARLDRWSRAPTAHPALEALGAWDGVFARIYRHEKDLRGKIERRVAQIDMLIAAGQALTDGVVLLDRHDAIEFCNTTAELQLGLAVATDRGQPIVNLVRQPEFVAYLKAGDLSRPLILRSDRAQDRILSIHVIPFANQQRLLQIKDVTQTDRLDRMRRDFVANVSHELRTPLTVLAGFLETLQEIEVDRDERQRYLALMAEQSQRMQAIVQDLLTLSSIESAPPPENEQVDMVSLIDKLRRDAEALSAGKHTIVVDTDGRGDLRGSQLELTSALGNLVANAVRYTPAGGTVRLSWKATSQGAEFAVEDTGIGIDAMHLPRLTERFYRVDRGRSRDAGGTGLGLAIVKHSLSRHQAQLDITSKPGVGSRFAARFPAARVSGV